MNSRILLIAFAIISCFGVIKSAKLDLQTKHDQIIYSTQPMLESAIPLNQSNPIQNSTTNITILNNSTSTILPNNAFINTTNSDTREYTNTTLAPITTLSTTTTTKPPVSTSPPTTTQTTSHSNITTTTATPTTNSTPTSPIPTTFSPISTVSATTPLRSTTSSNISGHDRQFDGPSFIGGIVLTVGLTAIGFIAFKFYKAGKLDMNYRTL